MTREPNSVRGRGHVWRGAKVLAAIVAAVVAGVGAGWLLLHHRVPEPNHAGASMGDGGRTFAPGTGRVAPDARSTTPARDGILTIAALLPNPPDDPVQADERGFAGYSVDDAHLTVTVWWRGEPPDRLMAVLQDPPPNATVVLHTDAPYTYVEGDKAAEELLRRSSDYPDPDVWISECNLSEDGSSLRVGYALREGALDGSEIRQGVSDWAGRYTDIPVRAYVTSGAGLSPE